MIKVKHPQLNLTPIHNQNNSIKEHWKRLLSFFLRMFLWKTNTNRNSEKDFLYAYTESFALFWIIFLKGKDTENMLDRFLEFITLYFPPPKIIKVARKLLEENSIQLLKYWFIIYFKIDYALNYCKERKLSNYRRHAWL